MSSIEIDEYKSYNYKVKFKSYTIKLRITADSKGYAVIEKDFNNSWYFDFHVNLFCIKWSMAQALNQSRNLINLKQLNQ